MSSDSFPAPVVLPHVVITVTDTGTLHVSVNGTAVPVSDGTVWTRSGFGRLLDVITEDRTIAVRVEVRESDGTVFTDIINARRPAPREATAAQAAERDDQPSRRSRRSSLVEVAGDGFVPGEDVGVAVIVSHTDATATGSARAVIDTQRLAAAVGGGPVEVVLLGRVSGTVVARRLP